MKRTTIQNSRQLVAYLRVSTKTQGSSKLGLEAQLEACEAFAQREGYEIVKVVREVQSGKDSDRPKLKQALRFAKKNGAHIVVAKLDRLSRSVHFISGLMQEGVPFIVAELGRQVDSFFLHIVASFAEAEAKRISERTKAALAAKRARGEALGNPDIVNVARKGRAAQVGKANAFALKLQPTLEALKGAGISKFAHVANHLNQIGLKTQRGSSWTPAGVRNIVLRLEAMG